MHFRITGASDAEIPRGFQFFHQLIRVAVIPAGTVLPFHFRGQVAPQCHDVFDAGFLQPLDISRDLLTAGADARNVRQHRYAGPFLDVFRDIERIIAGSAAGAVGDAHEGRSEFRDLLRRLSYAFQPSALLRRKHLERKPVAILFQQFADLHTVSFSCK